MGGKNLVKTALVSFWVEPKFKKEISDEAWNRRQWVSEFCRETLKKELKREKDAEGKKTS